MSSYILPKQRSPDGVSGVFQIDAGLQGIHACRIAFVLVVHGFDMLETYVSADFQLRQDRVVHSGPVESAE